MHGYQVTETRKGLFHLARSVRIVPPTKKALPPVPIPVKKKKGSGRPLFQRTKITNIQINNSQVTIKL